jgi:hypothetical protein
VGSHITVVALQQLCEKYKGKAIPLQAWRSLEGSRRFRFPDFKAIDK